MNSVAASPIEPPDRHPLLARPDPRLRRAVHPAHRAPRARARRVLRDPALGHHQRRRPQVEAQRHHPLRRPRVGHRQGTAARAAGRVRARRAGARHLLRHADHGAAAGRPRAAQPITASSAMPKSPRSRPNKLFDGLFDRQDAQGRAVLDVWMSHGDRVESLPPGFTAVAQSANAPLAAMVDESRRFYAVQFHPEVTHTLQGKQLLERFVREICGCAPLWSVGNIIEDAIARVRAQVGKGKVLLGLSGGVDSSVVAALLHKAIGDQLVCVFVDHGLHAPQRRRPGHEDLRRQPRREGHPRRCRGALPRRAARRDRPGEEAQDHRRPVREGVRRGGAQARRASTGWRRALSTRTSSSPPAPRPARRTSSSRITTSAACRPTCA